MKSPSNLTGLLSIRNQILAAIIASLGFFTAGMARAWASPAIPSLQGTNVFPNMTDYSLSYAPLSNEHISWISGLTPLGALFAGLSATVPLGKVGRRWTMALAGLMYSVGFIVLGTASIHEELISIYITRAVIGLGIGFSIPAAQIYISELAESHVRGLLSSLPAVFMALGTLVTYIVGAYLPWNYLSYFCAIFPLIFMVTVLSLHESPFWLLEKGKEEMATKALQWFRAGKDVKEDILNMKMNLDESRHNSEDEVSWFSRPVLFPLFLSMSLMFFQQWCGVNAVIYYTVTIFKHAGSNVEQNLATVIVGLVQFFATLASIFLVDKAGRKILLIASGAIMSVSTAAVGAFFYLQSVGQDEGLSWLPLVGLITFMIGYSTGFASVPYVMMGELFPSSKRNTLGAISSGFNLLHTFLVIKLFLNLEVALGYYGVFWIYSGVAFCSCIFVPILLPETKGKSLQEIEAHFRK